jgi:hypothetical protein
MKIKSEIMRLSMQKILSLFVFTMTLWSCNSTQPESLMTTDPNVHKVLVLEQIHTTQYTYLLVNEAGDEVWLALPKTEVKIGEVYYYTNAMLMQDFPSKELGRVFNQILFVQGVSETPPALQPMALPAIQEPAHNPHAESELHPEVKMDVKLNTDPQAITIAALLSSPEKFAGKQISIQGKVTKFNAQIMGRNWIHIQDGTASGENFDLTITTQEIVQLEQVYTFEGIISVNKDFGSGYQYAIILEDAKVK